MCLLCFCGSSEVASANLSFTDQTEAGGFNLPVDIGGWHGTYVVDYDNDGDEDLFMTSHGISQNPDTGRNALFRNQGNGTFVELARSAGVDGGLHGRYTRELHGAVWFDFDNDGGLDLFMPNTDSASEDLTYRAWDELYRNNGNGTFTNISNAVGLPYLDYCRRGAVAGDFNRDGFLDLFVVDMVEYDNTQREHIVPSPYRAIYMNQGGTSFSLEGRGIRYIAWSEGVTTLDYDGDGCVDILEADEGSGTGLHLWRNDCNGNFSDKAAQVGLPSSGVSLNGSVVAGDIDNDGDVDVYCTAGLFRNDGGHFTHVATFGGAEHMFFADLNHDGYIDLVSGGIFLNNGDGTFGPDVSSQLGVISEGRGGIAFDADGDGDLDFILNRSDRDAPYLRYYRNDLTSGTWLKVKLAAPNGQLGAPGAKVWVYERGHLGEPDYLLGYREVVTATGFVSGPSATQHFGLGGQTSVDVRARFITGEVEERIGVPANTTLQMEGTQPPVISNVASTNVTSSGSTITWVTDEPADSQVEYGLTTAYGITTPLDTTLTQDHSVTLSGLNANTTYHYRVKSKDAAGNLAESGDYSFTTAPTPDTQPPAISGVMSTNITSSGATIIWVTDEPANSQVEYGLTTAYGNATPLDASLIINHSATLFGLNANTTYYYRVRSKDTTGNLAESGDYSFTTTPAPDTQPPVISNVASTNVTSSGGTITWVTDEPADSQVEYGLTASYGMLTPVGTTLIQNHSITLSGLNVNTTYHYRVKSKDASGNLAESGDYSFTTAPTPDTQPPLISNVASGNITSSGATITWSTNEPADSQVEYGLTTRYGTLTPLDATITQTHSLRLSGLQPKRTYYYRVRSKDAAGNLTISKRYSFKTKADVDLIADELWWSPDPVIEGNSVIIGFRVKNVGSQSAGPFHLQIKRDGTTICTWAVFGLGPNRVFERGPGLGGAACSGIYGIPAAQTPGYNISFMVDDLNQVGETDEGNNTITKYMVVRE
jgi:phosphodiesterase/alkaline phosphatase D-like protein